jgi:hypothetical protein
LPPDRSELRSNFISHSSAFLGTPEGLNSMLPTLYSTMVGNCVLSRAAAARVLGELNQRGLDNLPQLVYEAFAALVADPYIAVHKAAVKALEHLQFSADVEKRVQAALSAWITAYAQADGRPDLFGLKCIRIYWHRYPKTKGKAILSSLYLKSLRCQLPYEIVKKLRWLPPELLNDGDVAALTIPLISDASLSEHQVDDVLDALSRLGPETLRLHASQLAEQVNTDSLHPYVATRSAEILTRAGAWREAAQVTESTYQRVPDTTQHRPLKLRANLWRVATKFEETLARGDLNQISDLAAEWRATEDQIEEDRVKHAEQRNIIPDLPLAN